MSAPKVLITDYTWPDTALERRVLSEIDAEVIEAPNGDEDTLARLAQGASAIMTCFAHVTPAVIDAAAATLKVVARYGVGVDNIAVDTATHRGIPVTNVPAYCVDEVAEHVLAMIFALERGLPTYDRAVRDNDWRLRADLGTRRIRGRTVGIVGGGRIGSALAERCEALGMRVLIHHPRSPRVGDPFAVRSARANPTTCRCTSLSPRTPPTWSTTTSCRRCNPTPT